MSEEYQETVLNLSNDILMPYNSFALIQKVGTFWGSAHKFTELVHVSHSLSVTMEPHWQRQRFFGSAKNASILCSRFAKLRALNTAKKSLDSMPNNFHRQNQNSFYFRVQN